MTINQRLPCHESVTWLHLSDLQNCGPCCTFRHIGQCHCQLIVQFNMLVVSSVTTISPRLGRPERLPLVRHSINAPASCCGSKYPSHAAISRANPPSGVLPDQLFGQSRSPSLSRSEFPVASMRVSFIFSKALARFCDDTVSCSTRCRDAIFCCHWDANSPSTAAVRGQVVNSLLRMPYVAVSVDTDMDSVTLAP